MNRRSQYRDSLHFNNLEVKGDVEYRGGAGYWTRLAIGAAGSVFNVVSGLPAWSTVATVLANILTTKGDVLTYSTTPIRLGVGANDTVLTADSAQAAGVKWAAAAGTTILKAVKTVDEIVNNSDVLQNDDALFLALAASKTYAFTLFAKYSSVTVTPDLLFDFSGPTGAHRWNADVATGGGDSGYAAALATDQICTTAAATFGLFIQGIAVTVGAVNLTFRWAQNTATLEDTKILADSYLYAIPLT